MRNHGLCVFLILSVSVALFSGCAATPDSHKTACASATCARHASVSSVLEPAKHVPVAYDVDVVVAGGGISGVFAALAAAREGASTVIIDRFGSIGGAFGPGMNSQEGANARISCDRAIPNVMLVMIQRLPYLSAKYPPGNETAAMLMKFANPIKPTPMPVPPNAWT